MSGATDLVVAFADALDTKDAERLGTLFSDDAVFVNIMGMAMLGRQGIIDGHRWAFQGPVRHSTVSLTDVHEGDGSPELAVVHARMHRGRVHGSPDEGLPPGDTLLLLTARYEGDRWVAIAAANVAVTAPPAGAAGTARGRV